MSPSPERFEIAVPDAVLDDLDRRLAAIRWPNDPGNEDWRYGTNRGWLEDLVALLARRLRLARRTRRP